MFQGKQLEYTSVVFSSRETESVEGRPIAMMAAQGLDVLWIRSFISLVFFVAVASGSKNGMLHCSMLCRFTF